MSFNNIYVGFDKRMPAAYKVCVSSILKTSKTPCKISPLLIDNLQGQGLYNRETIRKDGNLFDVISDAPMSTEFAISRFLVPILSGRKGWSLFCDSDFLFLDDVSEIFAKAKNKYAVMCVKHVYNPENDIKMDGQRQTNYFRKNWSSLILFNNEHPANQDLDVQAINSMPGRDLHAFCWLKDEEIGNISEQWNWLEGHSSGDIRPKAVHYTRGTPDMPGYDKTPYSDIWHKYNEEMNANWKA